MPLYEIMCITTTRATQQQLVNMLGKLAIVVQKGKGVFRRVEHLGVRPLAHRMKAHMKYNEAGRFMRLYIQASPVLCADVEQRLRVDDAVVKTLTIKHKIAAPVVVEKRVHNMKNLDSSSVTGILHHAPVLEYEVAKALLGLGLMRSEDILALPRYQPDASWEALRNQELLKRAHGGSSAAASVLQVPIPTRAEDLADMARLSEKEEADMVAYENYRTANIERKRLARIEYEAAEERALQRRMAWYQGQAARIRARALAKKLFGVRRPTEEMIAKLIAEGDPRPAYRAKATEMHEKRRVQNEIDRSVTKAEEDEGIFMPREDDVASPPAHIFAEELAELAELTPEELAQATAEEEELFAEQDEEGEFAEEDVDEDEDADEDVDEDADEDADEGTDADARR